ncbi:YcxB family protein [Cohnella caldifontis]|uniref:YcxB family protein n=1 Tax=Cohnella caldifontis TaxID=3027471 RepID=UPI0023EAC9E2|nr:YcxB family protein [Cohnella sp. YIM B05605]
MSETQPGPIRIRLKAEDYAGFQLYQGRWQLVGMFVFYACLFVLLAKWSGLLQAASGLAVVIPAALIVSGLMVWYQIYRMRVRSGKRFEGEGLSGLEQQIELAETEVRHTAGGQTTGLPWDEIRKAAESSRAILIYFASNKVILLPKRDIADLADVKAALRRHLPASKLRLKG